MTPEEKDDRVDSPQEELIGLKVSLLAAEQRARELEQALDSLRATAMNVEARANAYQRDAAAAEVAQREAEARLQLLSEQIAREREAARELAARHDSLRDEFAESLAEQRAWQTRAQNLEDRLEEFRSEASRLREELAQAKASERELAATSPAGTLQQRAEAQRLRAELAEATASVVELQQRQAEAQRLRKLLARVGQQIEQVKRSERWRLGGALVGLFYRLSFRKARPDAISRISRLLADADVTAAPPPAGAPAAPPAQAGLRRRWVPAVAPLDSPELVPILSPLEPAATSFDPPEMPVGKSADVIVCVHNALDEVRDCLASVIACTEGAYGLILINDGSDEATSDCLKSFADQHSHVTLIENQPARGYTGAANQGLRASQADYLVLLNSDTVVTSGWLARILECGESDRETGIVSPVSNSATWQSVPRDIEDNDWADNPLPHWVDAEDMGLLVAALSDRRFPLFPFLTGFCLAIKRPVIEAIGYFDDEKYPRGYGEETDYCLRAAAAGFKMRVADHCFVLHEGSRSFTPERRLALIRQNRPALVRDYGQERINRAQMEIQQDRSLDGLRRRLGEWIYQLGLARARGRGLSILYLLGPGHRASGGMHMIVDSAAALQAMGISAQVAVTHDSLQLFEETYPGQGHCFLTFSSEEELAARAEDYDVLVITHFKTARLVERVRSRRRPQLIAYYIQGFEPWIAVDDDGPEAYASYSLVPGLVRFAMTRWLCRKVEEETGLFVHKVEPGLHRELYSLPRPTKDGPVVVATMVRPGWSWRNPDLALRVMRRLKERYGDRIRVVIFGCEPEDDILLQPEAQFEFELAGVCSRHDMARLLAETDIVADCSTHQAYGLVGIEAMAAGCATVLPTMGGAGVYAIHEHNTLLVDTSSEEALHQAISRLVNDQSLCQRLAENGRRAAELISLRKLALSQHLLFLQQYEQQFHEPLAARSGGDTAETMAAILEAEFARAAEAAPVTGYGMMPAEVAGSPRVAVQAVESYLEQVSAYSRQLQQQLAAVREAVQAREAEGRRLRTALGKVKRNVELVRGSERWRLGSALVGLFHRLLFRRPQPDALTRTMALLETLEQQQPPPLSLPPVPAAAPILTGEAAARDASTAPETPLSVLYLLAHINDEASGGAHLVVDSVATLRALGIEAKVALDQSSFPVFSRVYPDRLDCCLSYRSEEELARRAESYDVLVITHFRTARLAKRVRSARRDQLVAYFVQDYEPWFEPDGSPSRQEALDSYSLIPHVVPYAYTQWIVDTVKQHVGLDLHRIQPGMHQELFPYRERSPKELVTVCTMVRPRSPRRAPEMTLRVMKRLKQRFGYRVRIVLFGCEPTHPIFGKDIADFEHESVGLLAREELGTLLGESDIFVDCSTYQAYGVTAAEAMSSGSAVVVPEVGGTGAYAVNGENALIVDTSSEDAILEAVSSLVSDQALRERLSRNGPRATEALSLDNLAQSQYALFGEQYRRRFGRLPVARARAAAPPAVARREAAAAALAWMRQHLVGPGESFESLQQRLAEAEARAEELRRRVELLEARGKPVVLEKGQARSREEILAHNLSLQRAPVPAAEARKVSIVIPNRDGARHLEKCLTAIRDNTDYPDYEVIVIDNASRDDSLAVVEEFSRSMPVRAIRNDKNVSFSAACNQGAAAADGDLVLFLNNDTEPLPGWLTSMVSCYLASPGARAVGARLIYGSRPDLPEDPLRPDLTLQHAGITFEIQKEFIRPKSAGTGEDPFLGEYCEDRSCAAVTAACMLVDREIFRSLGGFDEAYVYGYEDVDFCLRLLEAGHEIYYAAKALVFHYESATLRRDPDDELNLRWLSNSLLLRARWMLKLRRWLWRDKITGRGLFRLPPLHIVMAVTEAEQRVGAGDFFTASELGGELQRLGYRVSYVSQHPQEEKWYELPDDADVLVSLLDYYDLRRVSCANPDLITVAWVRNWTHRWVRRPWADSFDIFLANSQVSADLVEERLHRKCRILHIGTNTRRFHPGPPHPELACEGCFTGSYWGQDREIILNLQALDGRRVHVYGYNWEKVPALIRHYRGPLPYARLNALYNSTSIVIDDSNPETKPYGSVNSRVFDALAAGALVLTNNRLGAEEVFGGRLPSYDSPGELRQLFDHYLGHPQERAALVQELSRLVRERHSYRQRALEFKEHLLDHISKPRFVIKIGCPRWIELDQWGDYHMAAALKRRFELAGCPTMIQLLPDWKEGEDVWHDVVLVLRGLSEYKPRPHQVNLMWNISHPDTIPLSDYERYDHVFVASQSHAPALAARLKTPVTPLLQCTDPEIFRPLHPRQERFELLYVGNSREVMRKALEDLLPTSHDLAVYGAMWEGLIDHSYVRAHHYPNHLLRQLYGACAILLNDHWDDMRREGFVSNRLFDAAACQAFIISDQVTGLDDVFQGAVVGYRDSADLKEKIDHYLKHPEQRRTLGHRAAEIVKANHTFAHRAGVFMEVASRITPGSQFKAPRSADWDDVSELWYGLRETSYRTPEVECNLCGWMGERFDFSPEPDDRRHDVCCPSCGSMDYHRALAYYLSRFCQLGLIGVLDINPVPGFQEFLEQNQSVYTALAAAFTESGRLDLSQVQPQSLDLVLCRQVLERVPDDIEAMHDLLRLLGPKGLGLAIVQIPVEENLAQTTQLSVPNPKYPGRVRLYGADAAERFRLCPARQMLLVDLEAAAPREFARRFGFAGGAMKTLIFSQRDDPLPLADI